MRMHPVPRALRLPTVLAILTLFGTPVVSTPAAAQQLAATFPTAAPVGPSDAFESFAVTPEAVSVPVRLRAPEPTYWREGALIGAAVTGLLLWQSGWIELPGALILVPLGATVGALVGGQFPK